MDRVKVCVYDEGMKLRITKCSVCYLKFKSGDKVVSVKNHLSIRYLCLECFNNARGSIIKAY